MPSSGRGGSPPPMYRASASRAWSLASSKKRWHSALTVGSTASARAITASMSSTGESFLARNIRSASCAGRYARSSVVVPDLLRLLVPRHPLADLGAHLPLHRLRRRVDLTAQSRDLGRQLEARWSPKFEFARLKVAVGDRVQVHQVARDGAPPAPIVRGEARDPFQRDGAPSIVANLERVLG